MLKYLIQFNKDAWSLKVIVEIVFVSAGEPTSYVHLAYFPRRYFFVEVALVDVGASAGRQTWPLVNCQQIN
jgi:hypothetical protein